MDSSHISSSQHEPRFALIEAQIKAETRPAASLTQTSQPKEPAPPSTSKSSPSQPPIPSTEPSEPITMAVGPKKKGTAQAAKKMPKRSKPSGPSKKSAKRAKAEQAARASHEPMDEDTSDDDDSDHGPYCLCRGPDDHRWMIFCERCEDWFHGECINLSKEIGESLIEKFVCPNCTNDTLYSIYKKTCALGSCRKPARMSQKQGQSVFCSSEHAHMWWERMVGRLPKGTNKTSLTDDLTREEFMALLDSGLASVDEKGILRLVNTPFQGEVPKPQNVDAGSHEEDMSGFLTQEEKTYLENAVTARYHLGEETQLCHKMLTLIDLALDRRRASITAGKFDENVCGYDQRLDSVSARDAFAAFTKTPEAEAIFTAKDILASNESEEAMCEKKRCKVHAGWQKMMVLGIKYQIKEMASQAEEIAEEERIMREAAAERWRRKKAEKNWVGVIEC